MYNYSFTQKGRKGNNKNVKNRIKMQKCSYLCCFTSLFAGSKTPISKFSECKEVRWESGCP